MEKENIKKKFVFWGTPDVASETLEILKSAGFIPSYIITSPDKPQGRKMVVTPPPVKIWAEKNKIPYFQSERLSKNDILEKIGKEEIDLFLVVAYGKIIPEDILNIPTLGSFNIHYSILPKYRGASPVETAILNGDKETGVTLQKMDFKMDTGPIIAIKRLEILPDEKASELRQRLTRVGGDLLVGAIPKILNNKVSEKTQDEKEATYSKKIKKEDGLMDLTGDPIKNYNKFRAYATWPRSFFFEDGKRIIITDAVLENGKLEIKKVLPEGKKEMDYFEFLK
ncbi:MAG: methionyl-tRNA formyltransferase [Candidatus Paceibacterota bacterium]